MEDNIVMSRIAFERMQAKKVTNPQIYRAIIQRISRL